MPVSSSDPSGWIRRQLNRWFSRHHRSLPWRETQDAYRIWISEIMLQQTQVATVLDYYERFLERFPNVHSLAAASPQEVLEQWAGLGYYRRARNMHRAAQQVVENFSGAFPTNLSDLQKLAGVGRYTAGAIASFAYDQPAPILETNTIRLLSRLIGWTEPVHTTNSQKQLWKTAESLLPRSSGSGKVNQALMELGSLICTPAQPQCLCCPLRKLCVAYQQGMENQIPVLKPKVSIQPMTHVGLMIIDRRHRILLRCNPSGKWWEGLWDLPWIESDLVNSQCCERNMNRDLEEEFLEKLGLPCQVVERHQIVRHSVTRYRIQYHCFRAELTRSFPKNRDGWQWQSTDQLPPVVARFRRIRWNDIV